MWLKRPMALGREIAMYRISPNIRCHFLTPILFCLWGIPVRISLHWFFWCGGKYIVMLTVSITLPRRTYQVEHVQLSAICFFNNNTFLRFAEFPESQGHNTLSR